MAEFACKAAIPSNCMGDDDGLAAFVCSQHAAGTQARHKVGIEEIQRSGQIGAGGSRCLKPPTPVFTLPQ
jgi:hypothetical protein